METLKQGTIQYYESRRKQLDTVYNQIEPLHKELSELLSPWSARFNMSEIDMLKSQKKVIDSIPYECRRNFRSGMVTGISSEADNWFRLSIFGEENNTSTEIRNYLWKIEQLFRAILSASGFYSIQPQIYDDFGVYGLACYAVNTDYDTVCNFVKIPVGSFRYSKNIQNKVDTFVRVYQLSAIDIINKYGDKNVSGVVKTAIANKNYNQKFTVVHFVEPNENYDKTLPFAKNKKFVSVIYELGQKEKFLEQSGFDYMPYVLYEGGNNGENSYPCDSCGINALPDLKQTFSMIKDKMSAIKKKVKPPLQGPSNLKRKTTETIAEYYEVSDLKGGGISSAYDINIQLQEISIEINEKKECIKKHFFNDLFSMIINIQDKGQRTAFEISELKEEKVALIAPTLNQVHNAINNLFDILLEICDEAGLLPEPPEEIINKNINVELVSTLAQAQKAAKLSGIERYSTLVANLSGTVNPMLKEKIDWYKLIDLYADYGNIPAELTVSSEVVKQIEAEAIKQQQQQQQQQQLMQTLEQGSKVIDNIGGKDLVGNALAERFGL